MAIYEFECTECASIRELDCKMKDKPQFVSCTTCGSVCKSIISRSTFQLKGSAWASDNYGLKRGKR